MGLIYSIINHNDNSGKTIISFNLAAAMALNGKKVVYLSPFDNKGATSDLIKKNIKEEFNLFEGFSFLEKYLYTSYHSKADGLDFVEIDLNNGFDKNVEIINKIKDHLVVEYDYVFADTSSGLLGDIDFFWELSDVYIIPLEIKSESFDSLTPLFAKVEWLKKSGNNKPEFKGFLLNRVDNDKRLKDIFHNSSFYFFGSYVLDEVILYDELVDQKKNRGSSILDDIISLAGECFLRLSNSLQ